eukprot:s1711_g5.t1
MLLLLIFSKRLSWTSNIEEIGQSDGCAIEELVLDGNDLSDAGTVPLASLLRLSSKLLVLRLRNIGITDGGFSQIISAMVSNKSLALLDLRGNGLCTLENSKIAVDGLRRFNRVVQVLLELCHAQVLLAPQDWKVENGSSGLNHLPRCDKAMQGAQEFLPYCYEAKEPGRREENSDSAYAAALQDRLNKVRAEVELQAKVAQSLKRDLDEVESQAKQKHEELRELRHDWAKEQISREALLRETGETERSLAVRERRCAEMLAKHVAAELPGSRTVTGSDRNNDIAPVDVAEKRPKLPKRHGKNPGSTKALNQKISAYAKEGLWEEAINQLFSNKTVDVVSFNATIKACGKGTHWQLSTCLLKQMVVQEVSPDIISYNTTISACEKESQWHLALHFFEEMCSVRLTPDVITFSTVLRVCEWNRALFLLQQMLEESVQPNQLILGTAVHVCEKGSQWQEALNSLERLQEDSEAKLSAATFSAGMKAAKRGRQWQWAMHLLQMIPSQMEPRQVSSGFETVLDLCARAEQWSMVLEVFSSMSAINLRPSGEHLYSITRSCEKTGRWQLALHLLDKVWTAAQAETVDRLREAHHQSAIRRLAFFTLQCCESLGQDELVRQLKKRMKKAKIHPEKIQQAGSARSTSGSTARSTARSLDGPTAGSIGSIDGSPKSTPKLLTLASASDVSDVSQEVRQWLQDSVAVELSQRRHRFHCSIQGPVGPVGPSASKGASKGATGSASASEVLALLQRWGLWATQPGPGWRLELEVTRRDLALLRDLKRWRCVPGFGGPQVGSARKARTGAEKSETSRRLASLEEKRVELSAGLQE